MWQEEQSSSLNHIDSGDRTKIFQDAFPEESDFDRIQALNVLVSAETWTISEYKRAMKGINDFNLLQILQKHVSSHNLAADILWQCIDEIDPMAADMTIRTNLAAVFGHCEGKSDCLEGVLPALFDCENFCLQRYRWYIRYLKTSTWSVVDQVLLRNQLWTLRSMRGLCSQLGETRPTLPR